MAILDTLDVIKNLQNIHENDKSFVILKDFERVIDNLGIYVYKNWEDGELVAGPKIERHWVSCSFMWPKKAMPDPAAGSILKDYNCEVKFEKTSIIKARQIKKPGDIRPGTKKGKLDRLPVWVVHISIPKSLIVDVYSGDADLYSPEDNESNEMNIMPNAQPVQAAPDMGMDPTAPVPGVV